MFTETSVLQQLDAVSLVVEFAQCPPNFSSRPYSSCRGGCAVCLWHRLPTASRWLTENPTGMGSTEEARETSPSCMTSCLL